jgi:hypothetical protein
MVDTYREMIKNMEPGLERAILRALEKHIGAGKAIKKQALLRSVGMLGYHPDERVLRAAIQTLRDEGHLICSLASVDGGYYMAETAQEVDEFFAREFRSKIASMSHTMAEMEKTARERFGEGHQIGLGF